MKEFIVHIQSFRVQAESEQEAREKAEGVLRRCAYQPLIEDVEEDGFSEFIAAKNKKGESNSD